MGHYKCAKTNEQFEKSTTSVEQSCAKFWEFTTLASTAYADGWIQIERSQSGTRNSVYEQRWQKSYESSIILDEDSAQSSTAPTRFYTSFKEQTCGPRLNIDTSFTVQKWIPKLNNFYIVIYASSVKSENSWRPSSNFRFPCHLFCSLVDEHETVSIGFHFTKMAIWASEFWIISGVLVLWSWRRASDSGTLVRWS